jgi:SNF2 family DNA or RNA helicase
MDEGRRVVIFSTYLPPTDYIYGKLFQNYKCLVASGETKLPLQVAADTLNQWKERNEPGCLICTFAYGSEGAAFHSADATIFLDLPWSSIQLRQAEGRITGPKQTSDTVEFYYLVANNTVDEAVIRLHQEKREFDDKVIERILYENAVPTDAG